MKPFKINHKFPTGCLNFNNTLIEFVSSRDQIFRTWVVPWPYTEIQPKLHMWETLLPVQEERVPNRVNGLFPKSNQLSVQSIFCASFYLLAGRNCADYIRGVRFSACVTNAPLLWKSSAKNSKAKVTIKIKQHKPNEMQSLHCNAPILWSGSKRPYSRRKFLKPLSLLMITFFCMSSGHSNVLII